MSAPSPQRLGKALVLALATATVAGGLAVASLGLYRHLDSVDETPSVLSVASQHRTDPGGIYDRPLGSYATPAPTPAPQVLAAPVEPPLRESFRMVIERIGVDAGVFPY